MSVFERVIETSANKPYNSARNTPQWVLGKVMEEVGECSKAINMPERCDESAFNEAIDVIISSIDLAREIHLDEGGTSGSFEDRLEETIKLKNDKWRKVIFEKRWEEIFNNAIQKVIEQGKQSYCSEAIECLYRHPDGLKCIVGHMINDDHYKPEYEGLSVGDVYEAVIKSKPDLKFMERGRLLEILRKLQDAHDNSSVDFVKEFSKKVNEIDLINLKKIDLSEL